MLGYLAVPFGGPLGPLAIYLIKGGTSRYLRSQSAQALNLSVTWVLYAVCLLIAGAMLALDSVMVALVIVLPVTAALWLAVMGYVVAAALAVDRGGWYRIPGWICATIVR